MSWSAAKASTWLRRYADDLAGDAYKDGGIETLYAAAGAAYYAIIHGVGYNTQREFEEFLADHILLDHELIIEIVEEINNGDKYSRR